MIIALDTQEIVATADRLQQRIVERFPQADLGKVAAALSAAAREASSRAGRMQRPLPWVRLGVLFLVVAIVLAAVGLVSWSAWQNGTNTWADFAQGIDAGLNLIIVAGAAIFSLVTLERRIKRRSVLRALHELRVLAHLIELHQLTKDPDRVFHPGRTTDSSPPLQLSAYELTRYLDYCSEMLSLVGNLAAIYAQNDSDSVILEAVDAIESLTGAISAKIWQKIMIINSMLQPSVVRNQ